MDRGLHTGPVQAQFASFGDPSLHCQFDHAIIERVHCFWTQGMKPAQERGLIGHALEVDPAEPAQDQTVFDALFGFPIAPLIQMFADEHAENDFDGGGMPPMHHCETITTTALLKLNNRRV